VRDFAVKVEPDHKEPEKVIGKYSSSGGGYVSDVLVGLEYAVHYPDAT